MTPLWQQVNRWRVIPRLMAAMYGYVCWDAYSWITTLADPTSQQVTFATAIWGGAAAWFGFYVKSGSND